MSEIKAAADEAKKLVKMFHAVTVIASVFDKVANVEQMAVEVEGRLSQAKELEAQEITKREKIAADADKIIHDAKIESNRIISSSEEVKRRVNAEWAETKKKMIHLVEDSRHLKEQNERAASEALAKLQGIKGEIKDAQIELEKVYSKIAAAKQAAQEVFNA